MLEIIKYQLKGRKNALLMLLTIFGVLNLIAYVVEISGTITNFENMSFTYGFWIVIAITTTSIVTTVMFFLCATGHVDALLYKDSNYLMLTVPRHGWEILGGRFIAGLLEFLVYAIASGFLASIHLAIIVPQTAPGELTPLRLFAFMYEQVFFVNFLSTVQIAVICLCIFIIAGIFITFAVVASRSFVKNKGIATAVAIAVFVIVMTQASKWGMRLSERLDWYWKINFVVKPGSRLLGEVGPNTLSIQSLQTLPVPAAPFLFFLLIAAILFAAASWLMEKKVEL